MGVRCDYYSFCWTADVLYFKKLYFKFRHIKCKASFSHYFALGNKVKAIFCVKTIEVANEVFREYEIKILNVLDEHCRKNYFQSKQKIGLLRATLVVTDYIKHFHTGVDRHSDILMSLLLLVAETKNKTTV